MSEDVQRIAAALERIADRLDELAAEYMAERARKRRPTTPAKPPVKIDDLSRRRADQALRRAGIR